VKKVRKRNQWHKLIASGILLKCQLIITS